MSAGMIELNKENYQEEVANSDLPVVVDFWGPRCAPCLALMPEVEALAGEYAKQVKFCKLNAAENRRLCIDLKVMALPTFLFYKGGEVVDKLTGAEVSKESIIEKLKALL
jgi:thioredoxin 1